MLDDNFSRLSEFAVASDIGVHIYNDCTILEQGHGVFRNRDWSGSTKDSCSRDDYVGVLGDFTNRVIDFLDELRCKRLSIP